LIVPVPLRMPPPLPPIRPPERSNTLEVCTFPLSSGPPPIPPSITCVFYLFFFFLMFTVPPFESDIRRPADCFSTPALRNSWYLGREGGFSGPGWPLQFSPVPSYHLNPSITFFFPLLKRFLFRGLFSTPPFSGLVTHNVPFQLCVGRWSTPPPVLMCFFVLGLPLGFPTPWTSTAA